MDDDLKDLIAMVFYDNGTKSVFINITGFRNNMHGKDVSEWILETLNIEQLEFGDEKPTMH
tara:strand:+ start:1622 stop:1804 length:183 start_codon:yes stop_codon:yes gene_type:complete